MLQNTILCVTKYRKNRVSSDIGYIPRYLGVGLT